jgi:hypothetical protein
MTYNYDCAVVNALHNPLLGALLLVRRRRKIKVNKQELPHWADERVCYNLRVVREAYLEFGKYR